MKRPLMSLLGLSLIASAAFAVRLFRQRNQTGCSPPCPEWYADREFTFRLGHIRFSRN